jgi:GST-like protein
MLEFHNGAFSPNALKTKILLLELGCEYRQIDHTLDDVRKPAFAARFANAKVPTIVDDGVAIAESAAIALHLANRHGALLPSDAPGRARAFQAIAFEAALLAPVIGGMGIFGELRKPEGERDQARVDKLMPEAQRVAGVLGQVLGDDEYFGGAFGIADIQLWAGVTKAIQYGLFRDPPSNLVAWERRVAERPTVRDARRSYDGYAT